MTFDPTVFGVTASPDEPVNGGETRDDRRYMLALLREYRQIEAEQNAEVEWMKALVAEHSKSTLRRNTRLADIRVQVEEVAPQFRVGDSEHVDIPGYGRLQFRTTQPTLRVADKQDAETWCYEHERTDLLSERIEIALKVADYKIEAEAELARSGTLLPGIEQVPERTTMTVKLTEVPK